MLHTDACSYLLSGRSAALESQVRTASPDTLCISVVTRAELVYGIERKPEAKRLARIVHALLSTIRVLPWEAGAADWYGRIQAQLDAKGTPIGMADTMIAAHAIDAGAVLVTNNAKHYDRIKARQFKYVNWTEDTSAEKRAGRRSSKK
jgi:tRNA(fMet)-specific endonuclease VapC